MASNKSNNNTIGAPQPPAQSWSAAAKKGPLKQQQAAMNRTGGQRNNLLRSWFEGLSKEERMVAASFLDEAFLQTLASLKKRSAGKAITPGSNGAKDAKNSWFQGPGIVGLHRFSGIQWDEMYGLDSIQNIWNEFSPGAHKSGGPQTPVVSKKPEGGKVADNSSGNQRNTQHSLEALVNSVKIVLPTAMHGKNIAPVPGKKIKKNSHFVVLDFAEQGRGVKQIMDALDTISNVYFGRPFLNASGADYAMFAKAIAERNVPGWDPAWLRTSNKPTNGTSGDAASASANVPMYALLISRIEVAVLASYIERISLVQNKNGGAESGADSASGTNQPVEKRNIDDLLLMKSVLSQRERLASTSNLTQHKNDVILTKLFGASDNKRMIDPVRFQASMLVLVPISLLLTMALSSEKNKAKPISMGEMNARVEAALGEARRGLSAALNNGGAVSSAVVGSPLKDAVSSPPSSRARGDPHQTPDSASVSSDQVMGSSGGSSAKKRKKKKNKKKNKNKADGALAASPNNGSATPQNNVQGQSDKNGPRSDSTQNVTIDSAVNTVSPSPTGQRRGFASRLDSGEGNGSNGVVEPSNQTASSVGDSNKESVQTSRIPPQTPSSTAAPVVDEGAKDDDEWETVGTRSRGRKKSNDFNNTTATSDASGLSARADGQKKNKLEKKTPASQKRKNNQSRKIAREILFSVLDGVEEEVRSHDNSAPPADSDVTSTANNHEQKDRLSRPMEGKWNSDSQLARQGPSHQQQNHGSHAEAANKKSSPADQSTAPTYQETVSAVSGTTDVERREPGRVPQKQHVTPARSGNGQIVDDIPRPEVERVQSTSSNYQGKSFPLPTLLSPENANSTTSSVGSSLEAPHGHNHINASASAALDDNAVGFHLLDVCDRLSKDMSLFMKSRDHTVSVRRNERAVILGALQDTVSGIWPNSCRVELYGSCATLLDLPSSDLDVVITGLDRSEGFWNGPEYARSGDGTDESYKQQPHAPSNPYIPVYSPNAHRVMKLSAEIERLPWAVKVKSIPNATVPVIKILADPSKISGSIHNSDWAGPGYGAMQGEQFTSSGDSTTGSAELSPLPASTSHRTFQPWRGSDVMNGLISLDITFEGPEHGGIGSTEYSMLVVNQICQETGLRPEETPFVQCLMVLKELLAQRKLNEPYSGGLSSYALLLLMTALLRERAAIRAEIERSVQHRQTTMAVGVQGSTDSYGQNEMPSTPDVVSSDSNDVKDGTDSKSEPPAGATAGDGVANTPSASWASVARKTENSAGDTTEDANNTTVSVTPSNDSVRPKSFAEAVNKVAPTQLDPTRSQSNGNADKNEEATSTGLTSSPTEASQVTDDNRQFTMGAFDPNVGPTFFPQGFDDVIEVLCLGETTSGKLLMHFLLHYGQYFDATSTAIDVSGKHERAMAITPYSYLTPFMERSTPESIDPHTGMLIVDHIVIYDPLEGREKHNVARRCFAWPHVRWIFAQSYATLSSAVEKASPSPAPHAWPEGSKSEQAQQPVGVEEAAGAAGAADSEVSGEQADPSSQLLMCLISF